MLQPSANVVDSPPLKEEPAVEQGGAPPSAAAMLGGLVGAGEVDTDDEEREFDEPLCALVKNCNMLHNLVGPACVFLRQGFAQSQLVCTRHTHRPKHTHTHTYIPMHVRTGANITHKSLHPSISEHHPGRGQVEATNHSL